MLKRLSLVNFILFTLLLFCLGNSSVIASNSLAIKVLPEMQNAVVLNQLTKELLEANRFSKNNSNNAVLAQTKAKQRLSALLALIDKNPSAILRVSFTNKVYQSIAPIAQKYIEEEVYNLVGTFESLCALGEDSAQTRFFIKTDDGKMFIIHFIAEMNKLPKTGDRVSIPYAIKIPALSGDSHLIIPVDSKKPAIIPLSDIAITPTKGIFKTLAILINFKDAPTNQPWTTVAIKKTLSDNVSGFFNENSSRTTSLAVDTAGWFTSTMNSTDNCDTIRNTLLSSAKSAALAAGMNPDNYDRVMVVFPRMPNCGWLGLGYIGGGKAWGYTWINGVPTQQIMAHELGHNFGLYHSHSQSCAGGPIGTSCTTSEYGDSADTMGNKTASHFAASQKESLGWLDYPGLPGITTVLTSGNYMIEPFESNTFGIKAIRVPSTNPPSTSSEYYYVEYRQSLGYDTNLGGNLTKGVLIRRGIRGGTGVGSYMLNMTPADGSFFSAALTPGNTFTDPGAPFSGVTVTLNSADTTGANVSVKFGAVTPTCIRANPTFTVSPSTTQWVQPGQGSTYVLSLKNNDNTACTNSNFSLTAPIVAGVSANLSTPSLNLAPGATGTANLQIQSATTTADGVYSIVVNALNTASPTSTASITASLGVQQVCVHASPLVVLSPSSQTSPVGKSVTYNMTLTNNENAACTSASFKLASVIPSGLTGGLSLNALTLAPGASGSATLQLNSSASTPVGTYNISVSAENANDATLKGAASANYVAVSACVLAAPTVTISPTTQSTSGFDPVNYTVKITNNSNAACGLGLFSFSANTTSWYLKTFMEPYNILVSPAETRTSLLTITPTLGAPAGSHTISVITNGSGGAGTTTATSTLTYIPCKRVNPTVAVSPGSQTGPAGDSVNYIYTVTNNDNPSCPVSNFNLSSVLPTGMSGKFNQPTLTLNPGANAASTLVVTSLASTQVGTYVVMGNAVNASATSFVGSAAANYVLTQSQQLQMAVTSDKPVYQRTSTMYYANLYVTTTMNGAAVPSVPLVGTLTWPDGHSESLTTDSGSTGKRWFGQDIQMSSQVGTYKMSIIATYLGKTITGSVSFLVQ